ncbi:MAG: hypothetical protein JW841_03590 [Deltaproteobacteria bacterium]|nr:hypothetical protein [Deltaproteobacteria bacterium]
MLAVKTFADNDASTGGIGAESLVTVDDSFTGGCCGFFVLFARTWRCRLRSLFFFVYLFAADFEGGAGGVLTVGGGAMSAGVGGASSGSPLFVVGVSVGVSVKRSKSVQADINKPNTTNNTSVMRLYNM